MKKEKKDNVGITLVSLVITLVVLVLLAGVTISMITHDGTAEKAIQAKEKTEAVSR